MTYTLNRWGWSLSHAPTFLLIITQVTPDHLLYPNPLSELASGGDHLNHFEFLGRVLAKVRHTLIRSLPLFFLPPFFPP